MNDESTTDRTDGWLSKTVRGLTVALALALVAAVLTWLVSNMQDTMRQFEHRLTVLETRAEFGGQVEVRGGFEWRTTKGVDFTPQGGVRLALDIEILSEQFRWRCASPKDVVQGEEKVDLAAIIRGYSSEQQLRGAQGIIAVGTASTEGLPTGQEELARNRIETLVNLLQDNIKRPELPIYGYWLGQFSGGFHEKPCTSETANQRRVVLLKIVTIQKGLTKKDIDESVAEILLQKANMEGIVFPIDIRNYSRFQRHEKLLVWGRNLESNEAE